jgi:hypothetical protein
MSMIETRVLVDDCPQGLQPSAISPDEVPN